MDTDSPFGAAKLQMRLDLGRKDKVRSSAMPPHGLQCSQGMPAPHSHPSAPGLGPRHGRSGWFSHTQPVPSQTLHRMTGQSVPTTYLARAFCLVPISAARGLGARSMTQSAVHGSPSEGSKSVPAPRSAQLIQPGAAAAVITGSSMAWLAEIATSLSQFASFSAGDG